MGNVSAVVGGRNPQNAQMRRVSGEAFQTGLVDMDGRELVSRLFDMSTRARRLPSPSARRPEVYHEAKDELGHDIENLALEVERWLGLSRR